MTIARQALVIIGSATVAFAALAQSPADKLRTPEERIADTPGLQTYTSPKGKGFDDGRFYVYIPASYTRSNAMPLVVAAHGAGCNGGDEVKAWTSFAEEGRFIVVCPSYAISGSQPGVPVSLATVQTQIKPCKEFTRDILRRVCASLNIDRHHVLYTGFSAGGNPAWCAMSLPEYFTALCFRSANFFGRELYDLKSLSAWRKRPIYIFWGSNDDPSIVGGPAQGPASLDFLRHTVRAQNLKHEVLKGGGHDGRIDLVTRWFVEEVVPAPDPTASGAPRVTPRPGTAPVKPATK
jgi:poly(3-hydroxybutyrate) depolymerase